MSKRISNNFSNNNNKRQRLNLNSNSDYQQDNSNSDTDNSNSDSDYQESSEENEEENEEYEEYNETEEEELYREHNKKNKNNNKKNNKCENNNCDHKYYRNKKNWEENNKIELTEIKDLNCLIKLGNYYHCKMRKEYNGIDLKSLFEVSIPLTELKEMIGLDKIKEEIINNIIYFMMKKNKINREMMHTIITGSPGTGKTTFIEILARIYTKLGVLEKGHIVKVKRSDLIGKYLGHTAVQTRKKIEQAYGGILLIDEAYSLGNPEARDSFAKECLDTLNQALTEDKDKFICIIAGYKKALDESFFVFNEGLKRRFPFRFDIEKYNSDDLARILIKKIKENIDWKLLIDEKDIKKIIKENYDNFENQGGDMEVLITNLKISHNRRVFLLKEDEKDKLKLEDLNLAINKFKILKNIKNNKIPDHLYNMYV